MMATATPTLAEVLAARWAAAPRENQIGPGADVVDDALDNLLEAVAGAYRVTVDSPSGESVDVGAEWLDPILEAAREAGRAAWREHVEPAVLAVLAERIGSAPEWLRIHPKADELRADLAIAGATLAR